MLCFPRGVLTQGRNTTDWSTLAHKKITEEYSGKKKAEVVRVWQRGGSRSQQQQLLQGSDANLSLAERYFPLWRCETLQLVWV